MVEEDIAGWGNGIPPVLLAGNCWFESGACNHANSKTTVSPPAVVFFNRKGKYKYESAEHEAIGHQTL